MIHLVRWVPDIAWCEARGFDPEEELTWKEGVATCKECLLAAADFGDDCFSRLCEVEEVWQKANEAGEDAK